MKITAEQIGAIMPTARKRCEPYVTVINKWSEHFGINTPLRMAHFLAQIAHESVEMKYTKEIASGKAYEGRKGLGNTSPGDGVKYKGRGLIQLTGKYNYIKYKAYCGYDVVAKPELIAKPVGAVRSSMWFWQTNSLNYYADRKEFIKITKRINGGTNGLQQRQRYYDKALTALT